MAYIAWRKWSLPLSIVTLSGLLQFAMPAMSTWLRLEPDMLRAGQLWRLLSGQMVHLSWGHYLMNAIALLAMCALYSPWLTPVVLAWWMLMSALAVGLGLLWLDPQLGWYVGLSGVLHGLLVAGSLRDIIRREPVGLFMLFGIILKLAWEQIFGPLPGSEAAAGGKVIVNAHVYGAIGGLAAAISQHAHWRPRWRLHDR